MKEKDNIKELFAKKLANYEAKVDPNLWTKINSQVGIASSVASSGSGLSVIAKTLIAVVSGLVITAIIVVVPNSKSTEKKAAIVSEVKPEKNTPEKTQKETQTTEDKERVNAKTISETENNEPPKRTLPIDIYTEQIVQQDEPANYLIQEKDPESKKNNNLMTADTSAVIREIAAENNNSEDKIINEAITKEEIMDETQVDNALPSTINVELPNAFTPNGDGISDYLTLENFDGVTSKVALSDLEDFQVVVLDAFSKTVYRSSDPNFKWDGNGLDGMPLSEGRYVYFITATTTSGASVAGSQQLYIHRQR